MDFLLLLLAVGSLVMRVRMVHLVLLLVHAAGALWLARRLMPKQPLSAFFIVIYVGMYLLNPIAILLGWVELEPRSDDSVLFTSNTMLLVGLDLFIIAVRRFRLSRWDARCMPRLFLRPFPVETCIVASLAFCAAALSLLIVTVGRMGVDIYTIGKSFRAGGEASGVYLLATYALVLLPAAVFLIGLKKPIFQIPYLIPVAVLLVFHFLVYRIRVVPLSCLVAYVCAMFVKNYIVMLGETPLRSRVSWVRRMSIVVGLPTLLLLAVSIKYLRQSYGNPRHDFAIRRERVVDLIGSTFAGGDLAQSFFLRRALTLFPERHPLLRGQSYYRILFVPIPRSIWPDKPQNTSRIFAAMVNPKRAREKGLTLPPGLVGDLYINFGYFGVLGMFVFGFIFSQERYRGLTDLLFVAGAGHWIFYFVRGSTTNTLLVMCTVWASAAIITRIIRPVKLTGSLEPDETVALERSRPVV